MKVEIINPSEDPAWDNFVLDNKFGLIYHLSSWRDVIYKTFGYEPLYNVLKDEKGRIIAGLPLFFIKNRLTKNRLISPPLASYCAPLIDNSIELDKLINAILKKTIELNISSIEIKSLNKLDTFSAKRFKCNLGYKTHILALDKSLCFIRKSFHETAIKQCLKKAEKNSVSIKVAKDVEDMKRFYKLHIIIRKRHGLLPIPYSFFKNMWEILYPKGLFTLLLASYQKKIIAGAIFLKFKDTFHYEYSASDSRFLKLYPNHILLWEAIKMAHKEKYRFFDLGRSSIKNEGLITFKKRWGGIERDLYYYYYPDISGVASVKLNGESSYIKKINQKMPSIVLRTLGNSLYKYIL